MTIFALYFFLLLVRAQQGKVSLRVVEVFRIQHHDLRISSLVFGMAGTAFFFVEPAMESLMVQDVRPHFFVAVRTQFGLRFFVKANVAFLALCFELGVPLDHLPGHQRVLSRPERDTGKRQG